MYNGIGLQTARGSGTNGYVQRNLGFIQNKKDRINYKTDEELDKLESIMMKKPNREILDHQRKRQLEVKCIEMQELMHEQGYDEDEIERKVSSFRRMLNEEEDARTSAGLQKDEFGRPITKDTHEVAEAQNQKNEALRMALGLSEFFVDGSSFDPARKAKEEMARAKAMANQNYQFMKDEDEGEKKKHKKRQKG